MKALGRLAGPKIKLKAWVCWLLGHPPGNSQVFGVKRIEGYLDILPLFIGSNMIGNFLLWLQELIKHWIKPAIPVLVSGVLSDLSRSRIDLVMENALLRQ